MPLRLSLRRRRFLDNAVGANADWRTKIVSVSSRFARSIDQSFITDQIYDVIPS